MDFLMQVLLVIGVISMLVMTPIAVILILGIVYRPIVESGFTTKMMKFGIAVMTIMLALMVLILPCMILVKQL